VQVLLLESRNEIDLTFMRKLATIVVLGLLGISCTFPAYAKVSKADAKVNKHADRDARKAQKHQQKAQKKYAKAQKKAEKKMLKIQKKNTTYKPRHY